MGTLWHSNSFMLAPLLTAVILLGYAGSLWWFLRRESALVVVALAALCLVSLCARVVYTTQYPAGFNEDEVKQFALGERALDTHRLFGLGVQGPILLNALFESQLLPWLGTSRWAIRGYSIACSVLATAVAFAAARGMGLALAPSFAVGGLLAVLPWSLFFGRISISGELVFHQVLLLAALTWLVWSNGGLVEALIGGFALCLLLYDYACGRAMMGMPVVAAVLATRRRRLYCLAIPAVALAGWLPLIIHEPTNAALGFSAIGVHEGMASHPLLILGAKVLKAMKTLIAPVAADDWLTIRWAGVHPIWLLALAAFGSLTGVRRAVFLWAGFFAGLAPAVVSWGDTISAHRMLMAFFFICLAAGGALGLLRRKWLAVPACVLVVAVAAGQSLALYFSPQFWPNESRWRFETERSAMMRAIDLPPNGRLIVDGDVGSFVQLRTLLHPDYEPLTVLNWFPAGDRPTVYAFGPGPGSAPLRLFYEAVLGSERVQSFGQAFLLTVPAGDWSWMKESGWTYEARCGTDVHRTIVPALAHPHVGFSGVVCRDPIEHVWSGRWNGRAANLRVYSSDAARVETAGAVVGQKLEGFGRMDFRVSPGDQIRVVDYTPGHLPGVLISLMEVTPAAERLPLWGSVSPLPAADDAGGASGG